ncbi:lysophospholipid acyltransferase family protein [Tamilnaduibacter salinus]|uniref:lysophospholipid acyltransferase family protein n=1 Tax=Tamilnaduibacter salinus TaxID=1484056 RepID=UPI001D170866|nr:lysophospholipid acyltransferase family protein [Tamilnaduibacter salinus]
MKARLTQWLLKACGLLNLRLAQGLGRLLGRLGWWATPREREVTLQNLRGCYPNADQATIDALARHSLAETGATGLEIPLMWEWPVTRCLNLIREVDGEHWLNAHRDQGQGLLLLAPHLGNWELAGLYFASRYQMAALYSPPNQPGMEAYIRQVRSRSGSELVATDRRGIMRLFQILKNGGVVGILPDQTPRRSGGDFAPFFGIETLTMTLASKLAQKTRPTVLLTYAERLPNARGFRLVIRPVSDRIYAADMRESLTALNQAVEDGVREVPEQYQWEYKRFRRQPEGAPAFYRPPI